MASGGPAEGDHRGRAPKGLGSTPEGDYPPALGKRILGANSTRRRYGFEFVWGAYWFKLDVSYLMLPLAQTVVALHSFYVKNGVTLVRIAVCSRCLFACCSTLMLKN